MNKIEKKAYDWLQHSMFAKDIKFNYRSSPDFETSVGKFEVKKFYHTKNNGYIQLSRKQMAKLKGSNTRLLVFDDEHDEPLLIANFDEAPEKVRCHFTEQHDMLRVFVDSWLISEVKKLHPETKGMTATGLVDWALRLLVAS